MRRVLLFLLIVSASFAGNWEGVELKREGDRIHVLVGGRPFTSYYFGPATAKPYLFPLRSARGTVLTRGFPMVDIPGERHDEPHQRAMYFAHGDINRYDFWGEAQFPRWSRHSSSTFGRTAFRVLDKLYEENESGVLQAQFDLVTSKGVTIASETQAYTFSGTEHVRIIDCEFTIRATEGRVRIGDTKEGTFAIRLVKALASPPGQIINSTGSTGEKGVWGQRADWVDYYGNVAGENVGLAVFDHPENLRHPTWWHARSYGLLAANPFGVKAFHDDPHQDGSYTIPDGASITFRYRVLIHHGDFRQARVPEAYIQYSKKK